MSPASWIRAAPAPDAATPRRHTSGQTDAAARRVGPAAAGALALAIYLLLAFTMLARTWLGGDLSRRLAGGGGDPLGFIWFLAWLPHALEHGQSPLFSHVLMTPAGANLMNSTPIPLAALLLWPLTALAGAVASYDLLATLALGLSAWTAQLALARLTHRRAIAWVGGAIYGFGGYMDGQATAHVNLLIAVFPPLAAILIDDIRLRRRPLRSGALLGLCAAAQVFLDEEILATTAILAGLGLLLACAVERPSHEAVMRHLRTGALTVLVFAVLAGPALAYQLFGPQHVHGVLVTSGRYVDDLASFIIPNPIQLLSSAGSRSLAGRLSGADGELGGYLGLPLILLLTWALARLRMRAAWAGLLLAVALLFSLGPHLRVDGHDTGLWMPWILPGHLPLLENVVPDRFNLYIWLAAGALVVLLLDDLEQRPLGGRRAHGWALCALALAPIVPHLAPSELVSVPPVIATQGALARVAPASTTVLIAPYSDGQLAMYAEAQAGFSYRIPEGGVFVPGRSGPAYGMREGPLLYALAALAGRSSTHAGRTSTDRICLARIAHSAPLGPACITHYLGALHALAINTVVVIQTAPPTAFRRNASFFTQLLGQPQRVREALVFTVSS